MWDRAARASRTPSRRAAAGTGALILAFGLVVASGQVPPPPERAPMTPALERLLARRAVVVPIASGFRSADGPLWHPDGYLLFADPPSNRVHRWHRKTGVTLFREPSAGTVAMALDPDGRILAAEHHTRRISRIEPEEHLVTVVDRFEGRRLNSPNDLVVARDGTIYFTDPPYGLAKGSEGRELPFQGVYRLHPDGRLVLLVRELPRPNGIGLSPDGQTLYLTDSERSELLAVALGPEGSTSEPRVLAPVKPWQPGMQGVPDGLAVSVGGHILVAGPGGVWVFDPNGGRLGVIATPETPSAVAFGGQGRRSLFITARTRVYRVELRVRGL